MKNSEIDAMIQVLKDNNWYFFRDLKSGSYWVKHPDGRFVFESTPITAITKAYSRHYNHGVQTA